MYIFRLTLTSTIAGLTSIAQHSLSVPDPDSIPDSLVPSRLGGLSTGGIREPTIGSWWVGRTGTPPMFRTRLSRSVRILLHVMGFWFYLWIVDELPVELGASALLEWTTSPLLGTWRVVLWLQFETPFWLGLGMTGGSCTPKSNCCPPLVLELDLVLLGLSTPRDTDPIEIANINTYIHK